MTQHDFLNRLRSLHCIEPDDLSLTRLQATQFASNPVRFFIRADDPTAAAIWAAIEARQTKRVADAPNLLAALHEGRRAIGDHFVPDHCYATGPMTGDPIRDLVECPACSFIAMYDRVVAKVEGKS